MTGSHPGDDEDHLVIHVDAGDTEDGQENEAPEYAPAPLLQRYRYWFYAVVILGVLGAIAYVIGDATYDPPARLPTLVFSTEEPLYGTNTPVAAELDVVRRTFSDPAALQLAPSGSVFRLPLPRTVADRLFGERDEVVTIFSATSAGSEHRFLVLTGDGGARIFAIEAPLGLSSRDQPTGVFLALDRADPALGPLADALEAILRALDDLPAIELSTDRVYVFGPYQAGHDDALRRRVEGSIVMTHLAEAIEDADGSVSMAAPVFLVAGGPSRGTINAVYHPARRVVMEPLWGDGSTASLAHELTHAYLDTVVPDKTEMLTTAADYLERAHPVLHGEVVDDLYQRLGREGRAEESLAFITGALAAQQTKTVATQRLLENTGNLAISEAVLYSDIELLVQIGLLPACMLPNEGTRGEITQAYFEMVEEACAM